MHTNPPDLIPIAAPDIGPDEEAAVLRVLRSGRLAQGPEVAALEAEFAEAIGAREAIAVANGTAALQVALHVSGIGPGDEVLVPAFTFAATANSVLAVGAEPVFVDIDGDYLLDLADAETKVTERTAAIMPVHLYGLMVDMAAVEVFARRHELVIVEDAAQAHLATRDGRAAGTTGVGAFSLYATKNMTSGEGGLVTTNDSQAAEQARLFRNHGMSERYWHVSWGLNLRMTEFQAAIARVQLDKLPRATEVRIRQAQELIDGLPSLFAVPRVPDRARHVFHQFTVSVETTLRDRLVTSFRDRGIGADVYYPVALPQQQAFIGYRPTPGCPRAERAARSVLSLPVHPGVGDEGVGRILAAAHHLAGEIPS